MKKRIVWTYQLSYAFLLKTLFVPFFRNADKINYYLCSKNLIGLFYKIGKSHFSNKKINQFEMNLGEKYTSERKNLWLVYENTLIDFHRKICDELFQKNDLSKYWYTRESIPKVREYLEEQIAANIESTIKLIAYILWHNEQSSKSTETENVIIITKNNWGRELKPHIEKLGIKVKVIHSIKKYSIIIKLKTFIKKRLGSIKLINKKKYDSANRIKINDNTKKNKRMNKILVLFTRSIDLSERNDLYWLESSGVDPSQILICFPPSSKIFDNDKKEILKHGYNYVILNEKLYIRFRSVINLFTMFWHSLFLKKGAWQWINLFYLMLKVDNYEHLFLKHNVKIDVRKNVGTTMVPPIIALDNIKGVSIYVQWSTWFRPHPQLPKSNHIYFYWGSAYQYENNNKSVFNGHLIKSGYLFDSYFKQENPKSLSIRKKLMSNGANFIIALFDESYGSMGLFSKKIMEDYYKIIIEECIKDKTLGLIIKPKSNLIFDELESLNILLSKLKKTNRCYIFEDSDKIRQQNIKNNPFFPHTAAAKADLSINLISTSGVESILMGIPTIYYDTVNLNNSPMYQNNTGKSKTVFYDLNEMMSAIREHRKTPGGIPNFGDHSKIINTIDPYRDGQASNRIGKYIGDLFKELNSGSSRSDSIKLVNKQFMDKWGKDKVKELKN